MATIFIDGFDEYGPNPGQSLPSFAALMEAAGWTFTYQTAAVIANTLNGETGYSVVLNGASAFGNKMVRTLPKSYARLIGGFRFNSALLENDGIVFLDSNTAQCSIYIQQTSGFIAINQGDGGTALASSTASVAGNTTHYLEWDITFGVGSQGGWTIWLDGVQILGGTGTTQQSANASANMIMFEAGNEHGAHFGFDDLYLFDNTTDFNNATLLSNPIVLTQAPIGDEQTQFANNGNVIGYTYTVNNFNGLYSLPANSLYLVPVIPVVACNLNSIIVANTSISSPTAKAKGVVYSDNGGVPGTLLGTGTEVVGIGAQLTLEFGTAVDLSEGVQYWIGLINDTSMSPAGYDTGGDYHGQYVANTYSSGAPSSAPTMAAGQRTICIYGVCAGATTNWESENLLPPIGDVSSVSSASVGVSDLYVFPAIPTYADRVYTVVVSGYARLTVAGTHTLDLVAKSGSATGTGSNSGIAPSLSYAYYDSSFDTDPNTEGAWTPTTVTNANFGMKVAS